MVLTSWLLAFGMHLGAPAPDSARLVGDTLVIDPIGVRVTVPSFWMGRVAPGSTSMAGSGRYGCQRSQGPLDERVLVDTSRFAAIKQGLFGSRLSSQDALDTVLPAQRMVAHIGGSRFNGSCIAPQAHFYIVDSAVAARRDLGTAAQRVIAAQFPSVQRVESDSSGWHVVRLSWTDNKTDFIHPGALDIWSRVIGTRTFVIGLMDGWSGRVDVGELLASVRW